MFKIVEKANEKATHGIFDTEERAQNHLNNVIPSYCERGFFMDKTLTKDSFKIIEE